MLRCVATLVFCPPSTDLRLRRRRFPHRLTDAAHFASFSDARQDSDVVRASSRIGRPQLSSALIRRSQTYSKAQVYMGRARAGRPRRAKDEVGSERIIKHLASGASRARARSLDCQLQAQRGR